MDLARPPPVAAQDPSSVRDVTAPPSPGGRLRRGLDAAVPGREPELESLLDEHRSFEARDDGPLLTVLRGAPGVGLTPLARGLAAELRLAGVPVLGMVGEEDDAGIAPLSSARPGAYRSLVPVVRDALAFVGERDPGSRRAPPGLGCAGGCHRLWFHHVGPSLVGPEASPGARWDPETRSATPAADHARPDGEPRDRRLAFIDAVQELLREVAAVRPPLVLLGDVDRLDPDSRTVLSLLLGLPEDAGPSGAHRSLAPSCWLLGTRVDGMSRPGTPPAGPPHRRQAPPGVEGTVPLRLPPHPRVRERRVAPLDPAGVARYLAHPSIVARIWEATRGLPDRLDAWVAAGAAAAPEDRAGTPPTSSSSPAAPAHPRVGSPTTGDAGGQPGLDTARGAGLDAALARGEELLAGHALDQASQVLTDALDRFPEDRRAGLARGRLAELDWALGRRDRALELARRVAHRDLPEDPRSHLRLAGFLRFGGDRQDVEAALSAAEAVSKDSGDGGGLFRLEVAVQRAELAYREGALADAREEAGRALALARGPAARRLALDARNVLGKVALAESRFEEAAAAFRDNLATAEAEGWPQRACQARNNLAIAALRQGDLDRAWVELDAAVALAESRGAVYHRAVALENLAVLLHLTGALGDAHRRYQEAVRLLKLVGDRDMLARAAVNLAELQLDLGDAPGAARLATFGRALGGAQLADAVAVEAGLCLAAVARRNGDAEAAARELAEVARRRAANDEVTAYRLGLGRAELRLLGGDVPGARAELDALPEPVSPRQRGQAALLRARTTDDGQARAAAAAQAGEHAGAAGDDLLRVEAATMEGQAWVAVGDRRRARACLLEAATAERRLRGGLAPGQRDVFARRPATQALRALAVALDGDDRLDPGRVDGPPEDGSSSAAAGNPGQEVGAERPGGDEVPPRASGNGPSAQTPSANRAAPGPPPGEAGPGSAPPSLDALFYERVRSGDGSIYELRKALERAAVERALAETDGNITRAARLLGMKRPRLSQLLKEYGASGAGGDG